MATIKTQLVSGQRRIITKVIDGQRRVSCSCCEEPECCMYPVEGLASGLYSLEDLPDTIELYTSSNPPPLGSGLQGPFVMTHNGDGTYNGPNGSFMYSDGEGWVSGRTGFGPCGPANCTFSYEPPLVGQERCYIYDTFADTYTVELDYENIGNAEAFVQENVTVTRVSLCRWQGTDSCGNPVELWYNSIDGAASGQPVRLAEWYVGFYTNTDAISGTPCLANDSWSYKKEEPANVPTGTYHSSELGTVIVS